MTTLITKFDLKNGGSTPTGAVNRPINLKLAETVSVLDFGATGDGTTDDTTAIQNALNSGAKSVYIPAGTYKTTATIVRPNLVLLHGDGSFASTIVAYHNNSIVKTGSGTPGLNLVGDAYNSIQDLGIKNGATFNSALGLELLNLNQVCIKRVRIESGPIIGMRLLFVLNSLFEDVTIADCTDTGLYIYSNDLANGNNRNVYANFNFSYNQVGIVLDGTGTLQSTFRDIAIENSVSYPMRISNGQQVIVERLYLEGNTTSVECNGGTDIVFRDCHNVSNVQFINNSPAATNILVDRLYDPTNAGVATSANIMQLRQGQFQFPSTQISSANPNTLDDYREGTWTPTDGSGAGLTLTYSECVFTKIGRMVILNFNITYPTTASAVTAFIYGLPYISNVSSGVSIGYTNYSSLSKAMVSPADAFIIMYDSSGNPLLNNNLSGKTLKGTATYFTNT